MGETSQKIAVVPTSLRLFPFCKRSLPPLVSEPLVMMDVIYYNKANNTFLNTLTTNDVEAEVEFTLKVMKRVRVTFY